MAENTGWQPIETAPRDGADILVWFPKTEFDEACVTISDWHYSLGRYSHELALHDHPTHWMPLPEPPNG